MVLFSSLWVTYPGGMGFDFNVIAPLLPSHCSVSFVPGTWGIFFVHSNILLSVVVQQLVVILVLFQEKSVHPSTLSFWDSQLIGKVPDAGKD